MVRRALHSWDNGRSCGEGVHPPTKDYGTGIAVNKTDPYPAPGEY